MIRSIIATSALIIIFANAGCGSHYNISELNTYKNLTICIEKETKAVESITRNTTMEFEATWLKNDQVRATPVYEKAIKIKFYYDSLYQEIVKIEDMLINKAGNLEKINSDYRVMANTDVPSEIMIEQKKATYLKKEIEDTKNKVSETLSKLFGASSVSDRPIFNMQLSSSDSVTKQGIVYQTWESENFGNGLPLIAVIANLTRVKADLRLDERCALSMCLDEGSHNIMMDTFEAFACARSSNVHLGQSYVASLFLIKSYFKEELEMVVNGKSLPIEGGKGIYSVTPTKEGEYKWTGLIKVTMENGVIKDYSLPEQTYTVTK